MNKNRGIIYDLGDGRYGLARHSDQHDKFKTAGKVFLQVFSDIHCTVPEKGPGDKNYVTLKHVSKLKQIGFSD